MPVARRAQRGAWRGRRRFPVRSARCQVRGFVTTRASFSADVSSQSGGGGPFDWVLDNLVPSQLRPPLRSRILVEDSVEPTPLPAPASKRADARQRRQATVVYDPEEIAQFAERQPWAVAARTAQVAWALGRLYASLKIDDWLDNTDNEAVRRRSVEVRETLVSLGACYIKVGQALANRPDLVRDDYMAELEELQDNVPAFPSSEAMNVIRQELGRDVRDIFSELTREPVAAASLGQVYKGRLRKSGEEVAVKIQRPGLKDQLSIDMYILRRLSQLVNDWAKRKLGCNITLVVDEFGSKLWEEGSYVAEAWNAKDFAQNFADDPTVKIPRVYLDYTSEKVITMEWIEGVKSTDAEGMRRANIDVDDFTRNGVQAALRQLLEFGLFHGDPHAGNIFAMKGGVIAYVDFGNVAYISSQQRDVMVRAITHVSNSDYKEIANDFVRLGFLRPGTDVSELVPAMALIWRDSMGRSISDFSFRTVTMLFSKLFYQFPIRVPERFSLVIRALLMQEGICLCLNPKFSIIEVALPFASKRLLSDPDPSMRRELVNVVFREENGRPVLQWERLRNLVELAKQARDGTNLQFDEVIVQFLRGLRRDLLAEGSGGLQFSVVLRGSLEALVAGDRLRFSDAQQVAELLGPELRPELAQRVADALVRDALQELLAERGLELKPEELSNPMQLGRKLSDPGTLRKLLGA